MSKILFFDIDGTLVGFDGKIPDSTIKALDLAKKNGHKCIISTGRSINQIYPFLLEVGFDGIVAAAGGYVELGGREIFHATYGREQVKKVIDILGPTEAAIILQTKDSCVTTESWALVFDEVFSERTGKKSSLADNAEDSVMGNTTFNNDIQEYAEKYADAESMIYCSSPYELGELGKMLAPGLKVTESSFKDPDPNSGEITLTGVNKALGIDKVIEELGVSLEDTIAFGDGANDVDMIRHAGIGVVMGNGQECAKEVADIIAGDIEEDGLYLVMKELGLF